MSYLLMVAMLLTGATAATDTPVTTADSTCIYMYGKGLSGTYYVSLTKTLPFSYDEIIYSTEGKAARQTAEKRWQNSVEAQYDEAPTYDFFTVFKQSHEDCEDVETKRLKEIRRLKDNGYSVRVL